MVNKTVAYKSLKKSEERKRLLSRSLRHPAKQGGLLRSRPDPLSCQAVAQV